MRGSLLKDILLAGLALLAAFLFYSLLGSTGPAAILVVNAFSVVVVVFAVLKGEVFGAILGSACGLVQDAFSLGVFGVAGLTKALLGFWTGYVSRRIDVSPFFRSTTFLFVMSGLELGLWVLLKAFVLGERPDFHGGLIALQPVTTAVAGSVVLALRKTWEARSA